MKFVRLWVDPIRGRESWVCGEGGYWDGSGEEKEEVGVAVAGVDLRYKGDEIGRWDWDVWDEGREGMFVVRGMQVRWIGGWGGRCI